MSTGQKEVRKKGLPFVRSLKLDLSPWNVSIYSSKHLKHFNARSLHYSYATNDQIPEELSQVSGRRCFNTMSIYNHPIYWNAEICINKVNFQRIWCDIATGCSSKHVLEAKIQHSNDSYELHQSWQIIALPAHYLRNSTRVELLKFIISMQSLSESSQGYCFTIFRPWGILR